MFPPPEFADGWWVLALAAALGGLTRGFTGFGFAMVFMPLAATIVPPPVAVALIWVMDAPFALVLGWRARARADRKSVATLLFAATLVLPLGLFLLTALPATAMRWVLSGVILAALAALVSGWRYGGTPGTRLTLAVGSMSGLFSGLASLGGLPIALFWLSDRTKRAADMRADIQLYFGLATFVSGAMLLAKGLFPLSVLIGGLWLMPIYGAALWLGSRGFHLASEVTFRRIAYGLIFAAAVMAVPVFDGWRG